MPSSEENSLCHNISAVSSLSSWAGTQAVRYAHCSECLYFIALEKENLESY